MQNVNIAMPNPKAHLHVLAYLVLDIPLDLEGALGGFAADFGFSFFFFFFGLRL